MRSTSLVVVTAAAQVLSEINDLLFSSCSSSERAVAALHAAESLDAASRSIVDDWIATREYRHRAYDLRCTVLSYRDALAALGSESNIVLTSNNRAAVLSAYVRTASPCPELLELVNGTTCDDVLGVDPLCAPSVAEYLAPGHGELFLHLMNQCRTSSVTEVLEAYKHLVLD